MPNSFGSRLRYSVDSTDLRYADGDIEMAVGMDLQDWLGESPIWEMMEDEEAVVKRATRKLTEGTAATYTPPIRMVPGTEFWWNGPKSVPDSGFMVMVDFDSSIQINRGQLCPYSEELIRDMVRVIGDGK